MVYTLNQAVHAGDLILAFSRTKPVSAHMLLVKLVGSNNPHPSASSFIVPEAAMYTPEDKGAWMMSGSDVYYIPDDEEGEGGSPGVYGLRLCSRGQVVAPDGGRA